MPFDKERPETPEAKRGKELLKIWRQNKDLSAAEEIRDMVFYNRLTPEELGLTADEYDKFVAEYSVAFSGAAVDSIIKQNNRKRIIDEGCGSHH